MAIAAPITANTMYMTELVISRLRVFEIMFIE
jgi:hypothetical protein